MKHVVEIATIGLLLKDVETSRVLTTQGCSYLTKRRLCLLAFLALILQRHTSRIARVAKLWQISENFFPTFMCISYPTQSSEQCTKINKTSIAAYLQVNFDLLLDHLDASLSLLLLKN